MRHAVACRLLAGLCLASVAVHAPAADAPDFYARNADHLRDIPVHVVVLNADLRTQLPYGTSGYDPYLSSFLQSSINNTLATIPGLSMGQAVAAGAAGGLIAGAIIAAAEKEAAESVVEAAHATLQQAQCALPDGKELARALGEGASHAPWAGDAAPRSFVLDARQDVADVVDTKARRHVLAATYSMTPDFSTVITALKVDIHTDGIDGADRRWASKPVRTERLIVFSDQVQIAPKSAEDIEVAVALEKDRFAAGPASGLIAKANAGDVHARRRAAALVRAHERLLDEARAPNWTPAAAAARRSSIWAADGCQLLVASLNANNEELRRLVVDLYGAGLPVPGSTETEDARIDIMSPLATEEPGVRKTHALPGNVYLSRRGGDYATLMHLYTWYKP